MAIDEVYYGITEEIVLKRTKKKEKKRKEYLKINLISHNDHSLDLISVLKI